MSIEVNRRIKFRLNFLKNQLFTQNITKKLSDWLAGSKQELYYNIIKDGKFYDIYGNDFQFKLTGIVMTSNVWSSSLYVTLFVKIIKKQLLENLYIDFNFNSYDHFHKENIISIKSETNLSPGKYIFLVKPRSSRYSSFLDLLSYQATI
jgi:hypothetical protein